MQIRDVSIRLGEFAVHHASLDIARGEYFVLLGPTGAGKTVLLECVAGLYRPDRGDVFVDGERVNDTAPERRGLGYLPQDYALFPHLTVAQNIAFGMRLRKKPLQEIQRRVGELASLLGITHLLGRGPTHLSGGERQRVALARALAIEPKVLLLDEPLSALDEQTRENLCIELRRVHKRLGTTTLHVSHNFEETLAVADRIGVIHQGRVQQVGTPEQVFRAPGSEFVARFVRSENILRGAARRVPQASACTDTGLSIAVGDLSFIAADGPEGDVFLTVRPEEISIKPTGGAAVAPAANQLVGRVGQIVDKGALMRVDVDTASGDTTTPIVALVGRKAFQTLSVRLGDEVALTFDPDSVHVFAAT